MTRNCVGIVLVAALAVLGCAEEQDPVSPDDSGPDLEISAAKAGDRGNVKGTPAANDPAVERAIETRLTELTRRTATRIERMRTEAGVDALATGVTTAPLGFFWTGTLDGETAGGEVIFEDRGNKQLEPQWVPGDPRRNGRTDVGYAIAPFVGPAAPAGLISDEVNAAIDRGMTTWEEPRCSEALSIPRGTLLDWLTFDSDILHAGFAPLGPGVLGVTSPFIFVDPDTGEPTDIDADGHLDYAFAIIIYSDEFNWAIDDNIDVETVALHEAGHGLAQGHFGKGFITPSNGKIHFAPRSVMNAAYSGVQQSLTGTDRSGHCSMYGPWPNN